MHPVNFPLLARSPVPLGVPLSTRSLFRRTVRRFLKPLVMVGIAGTLSVSLIVTTPSNAQAFVPLPLVPVVAGATTMAMPSLLSASLALHPVGWAIAGTVAVGVGLYATKDYWLPYVTGEFGKDTDGGNIGTDTYGTALYKNTSANFGFVDGSLIVDPGGHSVRGTVKYIGTSTTAFNTMYEFRYLCNKADGTSYSNTKPSSGAGMKSPAPYNSAQVTASNICGVDGSADTIAEFGLYPLRQGVADAYGVAQSGTWYTAASGYINKVVEARDAFDPRSDAVAYRVDAECIAPDGTISTASASSLGSEGGIKFPSCEAQGKGHGTGAVKVFTAAPGFSPTEVLWEIKRPTEDPAQPLCSPTRPTSGCKLGVKLDGQPCVVGSVECENWSSLRNDPNYSTRLSCQYGPYAVAIETCNPLERAYEPGGAPATEPNTDGNPATRSDTMPNGQTQPKPDVGVSPGGFPTTGTNNEEDPCLKDAWSWTPADWVKNPVVCALKDAFVPKTDIQARSNELRQKSLDTVPISWLSAPVVGPGGGGCPNWTINVAGLSKNVICDSSFTAALTAVRVPLFGLVAAAMVWPLIRGIWYAAIPVLRVTPGSSK